MPRELPTQAQIVVPKPGSMAAASIAPGSGACAVPFGADPSRVLVHYEGNLFGASNLARYRDRVLHAYGRLASGYPTTAMGVFPADEFEPVGSVSGPAAACRIDELDHRRAAAWAGAPAEALAADDRDAAEQAEARELSRLMRSNPAAFAAKMARRGPR